MAKLIKLANIKQALRLGESQANQQLASTTNQYALAGRIASFRSKKVSNFIDLIDGSTSRHIQLVVDKELLRKPEIGAYLSCEGRLVSSPGRQQSVEFKADKLNYASRCHPEEYPLVAAAATATTSANLNDSWFRDYTHLRPRAAHFASLLRVSSEMELSISMLMKQMDFFRVHTPILTGNDSEASSDLFTAVRTKQSDDQQSPSPGHHHHHHRQLDTDYFGRDVYMGTSAQLHLESLAASLSRVYTIAPCFRAENSVSQQHLCEFMMFEAEEANLFELDPLMDRVESIVKFVAQFLGEVSEFKEDFHQLLERYKHQDHHTRLIDKKFIRMHYREAIEILQCAYGADINRTFERRLLEHCNNVPIFITNYPRELKPFYMKCDSNGATGKQEALCFDLIAPFGGEICGGSLREDDLDRLRANLDSRHTSGGGGGGGGSNDNIGHPLQHHQEEQEARQRQKRTTLAQGDSLELRRHQQRQQQLKHFDWYLDLRRFGSFPHGGFGLGFGRLIQALVGVVNIKDTLPFPRWAGQCAQ